MSDVIVRVELHGQLADYTALHKWMKAAGFFTTIVCDEGDEYHLPSATYRYDGDLSAVQVRDWLVGNMLPFGSNPKAWLLVTQSVNNAWVLRQV